MKASREHHVRGRSVSVAIIGAGFGGLGMAIRLTRAGYDDVTVFEKGDDVGGVWRENVYPGAACDVPSHLYSFSFEPKPDWSRRFAPQSEILEYLRHCADTYDVRRRIRFGTEVESADFDEENARWSIVLSDGSTHVADVLVSACGQLSRPAYPDIPGLDDFDGEVLHSATWRPDLDLAGKDVAVIGTGASAIQIVPQVAPAAGRLTLFQREAAHVIPKGDRPYSERARTAYAKVPGLLRASRWATYWQLETRAIGFTRAPQLLKVAEVQFRMHLRRQVPDRELRRRLVPKTVIGCKRILISNDYFPALVRPNVSVVTEGISAIASDGVTTADGAHHPADVLVLGTGFTATDLLAPMRIRGLRGTDLNDAWRDGAEAHLGITVHGFPNLFLLYGPNTNLGHSSIVFMLEAQIGYVMQAVEHLRRGGARWLDVREDVQRSSADAVQARITRTVWDRGCTSWYRTSSGRNTLNWPGFTVDYWRRTRRLRLDDFVAEPAPSVAPRGVRRMPSARLTRPSLPPAAVRSVVSVLQRTVFQPHVGWPVQRRRLRLAARTSAVALPRGTQVTRGELGGVPVVRVSGPNRRSGAPPSSTSTVAASAWALPTRPWAGRPGSRRRSAARSSSRPTRWRPSTRSRRPARRSTGSGRHSLPRSAGRSCSAATRPAPTSPSPWRSGCGTRAPGSHTASCSSRRGSTSRSTGPSTLPSSPATRC